MGKGGTGAQNSLHESPVSSRDGTPGERTKVRHLPHVPLGLIRLDTMRVAVLQTDPSYRNLISDVVKRLGHSCVTFGDGLVLSKALSRSTVDLLILDWNSTGLCGLDLLKSVRSSFGERVPVLFATPDGAEHNIVCALTAGADDYVVYPIRPGEFGARIEALLRRAYPATTSACLEVGPYRFDARQQTVTVRGKPVQLSGTQLNRRQTQYHQGSSNIPRNVSNIRRFSEASDEYC